LKLWDAGHYSTRLLVFASLLALPFLRMLLRDDYGFLHIEVAVAMALLVGAGALMALAARGRFSFPALVVALSVLLSVNALQMDFLPGIRLRWLVVGLAALLTGAILLLRHNFYVLLLIFQFGGIAVDVGTATLKHIPAPAISRASASHGPNHVVHLIFDEMIGLGSAPPECIKCGEAFARMQEVLKRGNFQVYPYAYSNYRGTRDSIPSILNGRLLKHTGEFIPPGKPKPFLRENRYFESYLKKGYTIRTYESDYLLYSAPEYPSVQGNRYQGNNLKALHLVRLGWLARMRQLFVIYLQADGVWWGAWTRFLPEHFHLSRLPMGPLVTQDIWPGQIFRDYRAATENTLFFAHLMMPHYPYVYTQEGFVRDPREWKHQELVFTDDRASEYWRQYELYGEQVYFLTSQLESFLQQLKATGSYDSATIIIHGDHGSRLRLLKASERWHREQLSAKPGFCPPVSRYDYVGQPEAQDLLNRFATFLAIKLPGMNSPEIIREPGSVLYFLQRTFQYRDASERDPGEINSVYLFDPDGSPRRIEMMHALRIASERSFEGNGDE
jgi:hypothetical protein